MSFNSDGAIWLMEVSTGVKKMLIPCIEVMAEAMAFSPDSSTFALGTGNGVMYVFQTSTGALKSELRDEDAVLTLDFGPNGLLLATRSDGVSIWNTRDSRREAFFYGGTCADGGPCVWQYFDSAHLSPDGKLLATSGRENSGITVRDMTGRVRLWIKDDQAADFLFVPDRPNVLLMSRNNEFVHWDVSTGQVLKRVPHDGSLRLQSFVPGSSHLETVVSAGSNEVRFSDINTGKVLKTWYSAAPLSWVAPDGSFALSDHKVIDLRTRRQIAELKYFPSEGVVAPWNPGYQYLSHRIISKEPALATVVGAFVLLGIFGYVLSRVSPLALLPYFSGAAALSIWWISELYSPGHGPALSNSVGTVRATFTLVGMVIALCLPVIGSIQWRLRTEVPTQRGLMRWSVPVLATCTAALLLLIANAEANVIKERYQVEGDVRAGGELRGSGLVPWYTRNLAWETNCNMNSPVMWLAGFATRNQRSRGWLIGGTLVGVFTLWSVIGACAYAPPNGRKWAPMLRAGALFLVTGATVAIFVILYIRNPIYRAYTPPTQLVGRLLWSGWMLWCAIVAVMRSRRPSPTTI